MLQVLHPTHGRLGRERNRVGTPLAKPEQAADAGDDECHAEVDPPARHVLRAPELDLAARLDEQPERTHPPHRHREERGADSAMPGSEHHGADERGVDGSLGDLQQCNRAQEAQQRHREGEEVADASRSPR